MKRSYRLVIIVFLLFIFSSFLFPGVRVANDYPLISKISGVEGFSLPSLWSERSAEGMGEYVISTLWSWPMDFLYGLLFKLGLNFSIVERLLGIIPVLILGYIGIGRLLSYFKIEGFGRVMGTLLYLTNTYIILLIDGGQFSIGIAYAFLPISFISVIKAIRSTLSQKIIAALTVSILGIFDIRFIYILLILLFIYFTYECTFLNKDEMKKWIVSWFLTAFIILLIFTGINFYWILPALLVKTPILPATYQRVSQTSFLSFTTLGHALFLLQPHWFLNVFGKVTPLIAGFALIPLLVFLAPVLVRKNKDIGFWILVALVGIFLTKGENAPLGNIYNWLFINIPGFSLFRDSTKFYFLITISYCVLIGITVDWFSKNLKWNVKVLKYEFPLIPLFLPVYFLYLVLPTYSGKMTGTLSEAVNKSGFERVSKILENDRKFGRVLWIPSRPALSYSSTSHPVVEASRIASKRPFSTSRIGNYEIFNYLREAPFMGEIFDISGIKYIVYPFPDTRREDLKQDNIDYYYAFFDQIKSLPWVSTHLTGPPTPILEVRQSQDRFFVSSNTLIIVGSDSIYNDLVNIDNFSLKKNALIFAEESPSLGSDCDISRCSVLIYDKGRIDFAATFIDKSLFIFPSKQLNYNPNETGYWKRDTEDFHWMKNFLQEKYSIYNSDYDYGGGYAIAEGNKNLRIANNIIGKDKILLARVMQSGRGGSLEFFQGETKIGEVVTKIENAEKVNIKLTGYGEIPDKVFAYDKSNISWFEIGKLIQHDGLEIRARGDINIVNALAVVPQDEWLAINSSINKYNIINWEKLNNNQITDLFLGRNSTQISYKRISATYYKVRVEGLGSPSTLAFSETFDPLWEITNLADDNKSNSFPLYSLVNGFYIDKDGEYAIYFSAQKYVYIGLYISLVSLISVFVILLNKKRHF